MAKVKYQKHIYDLELKSLLINFIKGISKVNLQGTNKSKDYYIKQIRIGIDQYCKFKGFKYDEQTQILVSPIDDGSYKYFLGLSLIFYDVHKISSYLNYHENQFLDHSKPDKSSTAEPFIGIIEYIIVDIIKSSSPFENEKRLNKIMEWVEIKKMPLLKSQLKKLNKNTLRPKNPNAYLILVNSDSFTQLKALSKILQRKKLTVNKNALLEVINCRSKIRWNGGLEEWVYFMYKLSHHDYNFISTSEGPTPYLKIGRDYFHFILEPEDISNERNLSTLLYNVKNEAISKHLHIRTKIDAILLEVFSKPKIEKVPAAAAMKLR